MPRQEVEEPAHRGPRAAWPAAEYRQDGKAVIFGITERGRGMFTGDAETPERVLMNQGITTRSVLGA